MLELTLCSMLTILPDYLIRRYVQGKRIGHEITLFSVWYELRWGITLCVILTVLLITTVFYFHPATRSATAAFRTVTILTETSGRVEEVFVGLNDKVEEGQPLFRLDNTEETAAVRTGQSRLAELEAAEFGARAQLAQAEASILRAQASLQQAEDEYQTRLELFQRNADAIPEREVERARVNVAAEQASVDAAMATRDAVQAQLDIELPAQIETARAELDEARVDLEKTTVRAGVDGRVQQFALRRGDIVNPMIRPAGILIPADRRPALLAGFGQIEAQVMVPGMTGEAVCIGKPFTVVPMVVTEVQDVIAAGAIRPSDQLFEVQNQFQPGSITVYLQPMFEGGLDGVPIGGHCIVNAYTSHHEILQSDQEMSTLKRFALHGVDTVGLVHALILRIQALLLPLQTLVFSGGH